MTELLRQVQHLHTQMHDSHHHIHKRPQYGRAEHDTPQNYVTSVLWKRWIESFICQMRRGRLRGERSQREDRCQMCVCKEKRKYRVEQRFGDTEVNFCQRWRERSCGGCQVWYLVFAWCVWSPSDQIWVLTDSFQRVNTGYTHFLYLGHTEETGLWTGPGVSDCQGLPKPLVQGSHRTWCVCHHDIQMTYLYNRILTIVTLSAIYGKKPLAKLLFYS